ncbi:MAG: methyltransferase domain-containing protein [Okeania sp. SIO2C2]|uniref:class I SAM-dependent methyltransferase n=1 Tax=Okeania sp. SIO2C2 TaxID=2607787 RepID=UPI0013B80404|nr:class I SAM-dependent methyltransferase [Okeania sp. SIO2C2]NEP90215.1 methyltransferase domain-containing protein [Okeania sp. SIO2C2]
MSNTITKLTHQTFQQGKIYFALAHKQISTKLRNFVYPTLEFKTQPLSPAIIQKMQKRIDDIMERDVADGENGIYPVNIIFDNPWSDFFSYYPHLWLDMPTIWNRIKQKKYQEFSQQIDTQNYPSYYLQNFHYQTDGYLSDTSANLYDLQVELLFNGTADAMRRRILAPLKIGLEKLFSGQKLEAVAPQKLRVLDIACGTGRTLKFIRATLPKATLYGVDLSSAYLKKAHQLLSEDLGELPQLLQGNAEDLPLRDNFFQATTCVFMFHELPPIVRQKVIEEAFRVTQPGGVFVICDSIQVSDEPDFAPMLKNFPAMFHEPYYQSYITDSLEERLEKVGFINIATEVHFVSKYWVGYKPVEEVVSNR